MDGSGASVEIASQQESAARFSPGTEIPIANWGELDGLVQQVGKSLNPGITPAHFTQYDSLSWEQGYQKPLSTRLRGLDNQRRFHGRTANMRVTILPPDISFTRKPQTVDASQAVTFLVERELDSTGRGEIVRDLAQCSVYTRTGDAYRLPKLAMRALNRQEVKEAIGRLLNDSRLQALRARMQGYRRAPAFAGLPSLGKRR